jgi:N6-L-threonylcarbamoyladenine synthase
MQFKILGQTRDDAAGEAIDKIGRLIGLGYPAGPAIERLAKEAGNKDYVAFPRAMLRSHDLDFSFSGLKTAFLYHYRNLPEEEKVSKVKELASSFQEAVFDSLLRKTEKAIQETTINRLVVGGGVIANIYLRTLLRRLVKKHHGSVIFPPFKYLTGDNAAMIGVAAYYMAQKGESISPEATITREPRLSLS